MALPSINTYVCNTCKRSIAVPNNLYGISTLRKCIITQNCKGTMTKQLTLVKNTDVIPVAVPGMQDWEQRNALFTYNQTIPSKTWVLTHNMGLVPILQVYIYSGDVLQATTNYTTTVLSPYQIQINFNQQQTGTAQCIVSNAIPVQPRIIQAPSAISSLTTPISVDGILTVGILNTIVPQSTNITFTTSSSTSTIQYKFLPEPNINSPWHDYYNVLINNQIYNIYTINFNELNILPGSFISFFDINDIQLTGNQMVGLMASSPYTNDDKITKSLLYFISNQQQLTYNNGTINAVNSFIQSIYPYITESSYSSYTILPPNSSTAIIPIPNYVGFTVSSVDELMQQYTLYPNNWNLLDFPAHTGFLEFELSVTDVAQVETTPSFERTLIELINSANNSNIAVYNLMGNTTWLESTNSQTVFSYVEQLSNLPFGKVVLDVDPQNGPGATLNDNLNLMLTLISVVQSVNTLPLWIALDYTVIAPGWISGTPSFSTIVNALYQLNIQGIVVKFYSTNTAQQVQFVQALLSTYPQMQFLLQVTMDSSLPPSQSYGTYNLNTINSNLSSLYTQLTSLGFNGIVVNSWNEYFLISNPITTV